MREIGKIEYTDNSQMRYQTTQNVRHDWLSLVGLTLLDDVNATADVKKESASLHPLNVQSVRHGIVQMNSATCWEQAEDSRRSICRIVRDWI